MQVLDIKKYKDINILNTAENFKKNLENQCITNLEEAYPENKYNADIDVVYDIKMEYLILIQLELEL